MDLTRLVVHIPRWLRWSLLVLMTAITLGFAASFFIGISRPGSGEWMPAAVSIVQIALTAIAYIVLIFFTESARSPQALQARSRKVLVDLLPQTLARITDMDGRTIEVAVDPKPTGVVGHVYRLSLAGAGQPLLKFWVGLNVRRTVVSYACSWPRDEPEDAFRARLEEIFSATFAGARTVGYDPAHYQLVDGDAAAGGERYASIWLTWNMGPDSDFLTSAANQLFYAQDIAMMTQSVLRTAQRNRLVMSTGRDPNPL